jgi:uncharacterized protein (TIGR01319 family)
MKPFLFVDFGSTYTKVRAVDVETATLLGSAQSPTTVTTDIMLGLNTALAEIERQVGKKFLKLSTRLASSSAAGGLRMVVVGLVPALTAEAGKMTALGAGAKVVGQFHYFLTQDNLSELERLRPDIILLVGGTDGGNETVILHNAAMLVESESEVPIVVAGNRDTTERVSAILRRAGKDVRIGDNVLPALNFLNPASAQGIIRDIFINRIIHAKGLSSARAYIGADLLPTPMAVLQAAHLLADGTNGSKGLGEIMVVDVGGATTDVYSVASGNPRFGGVTKRGIPEPYVKRTVEGDLGIRINALTIFNVAGPERLERETGVGRERLKSILERLAQETGRTPLCEEEYHIDEGLARTALNIATERHCGKRLVHYNSGMVSSVQYGKDLTAIRYVIGTAGPIVNAVDPKAILCTVQDNNGDSSSLRPSNPEYLLDREYILFALGLLADIAPCAALRIAEKYLPIL